MDARMAASSDRVYEDFEPRTSWAFNGAVDTFLVYLPDFNKENLRVQLTASRMLKISGQRPIEGKKWRRFVTEVHVPENCDTTHISAKFQDGTLNIRLPKLITPVKQASPALAVPLPQEAATTEPPPQPAFSQASPQYQKSDGSAVANEKSEETNETQARSEDAPPPKIPEKGDEPKEKQENKENLEEKGDDTRNMEAMNQLKDSVRRLQPWSRNSSGDFFTKLKKPSNMKMVGIVVLGTLTGLLIISMLTRYKRENKEQ